LLTVVHDAEEANDNAAGRSLLDEIVRDGARKMLAAALQAEVAAYIEQFVDQRDEDGRRLVVRNGYHQAREVLTAAGAVEVKAPRVNDRRVDPDTGERQRFSSAILPAWARKSPQMSEVLPLLYLHGLSTSDFGPALEHFLGSGAGLSATTITRLTAQWQDEARTFAARDLSGSDYVYLWVDGIHLKVRLDQEKLCLLVMLGVRADGRKELVAITDGYRESTESWADLLRDCARRGMTAPVLAIGDGALGFWKAVREVFPATKEQRCWFHKQANVLAALPKSAHPAAIAAMKEIYNAEDIDKAQVRGQSLRRRLRRQVPQGRRQDHRRPRHAVGVLPLPGRALDPPTHHQPNRKYLRHSAFADESHQGPGITHRRSCHGLQADRRRTGSLAGRQRPPPGRTSPRRRRISQRQTARTPHRHHPTKAALRRRPESWNGGRLKHPNPQILTIPLADRV